MERFLKKTIRKKNQAGFTLAETLVAATILMLAILGANTQFLMQLRSEASVNLQTKARTVLNQLIAKVQVAPQDFPATYDVGVASIDYIICMNEAGSVIGNKYGISGFYAAYIGTQSPSDFCPSTDAFFEGRITPTGINSANVDLFILPRVGRGFTLARTWFRSQISFESSL